MVYSIESIMNIVKHLQRTRVRLMEENDELFNETIRYRTERETYHLNPTSAPERLVKEHIADRMFQYYNERLEANNLFLDQIEDEMAEWVEKVDENLTIDDFLAVYFS